MKYLILSSFLLIGLACTSEGTGKVPGEVPAAKELFGSGLTLGVSCYRIPSLITAPNGDLVAVVDERIPSCSDLRSNDDINIVSRFSEDGGETWSELTTVVDYPRGQSASDPSMIVDSVTGEIFLFYNFMDHVNQPDVYYLHVVRSLDNGRSWSKSSDITTEIAKPEWQGDFKFITSGRGIQTHSGMMLHTLVNLDSGLHVFGSSDHGDSWFLIDTPIKPANESKVVEVRSGVWMINSRIEGGGVRYVHVSSDYGVSWESRPDSVLIDPGCNASIISYPMDRPGSGKNRLVFSNAASVDKRENLTVRVSDDGGVSWSAGKTVYAGSAAYSTLSVLPDGRVGLLFEADNYARIQFVQISMTWLTNGDD